jgi:hypothetical protein
MHNTIVQGHFMPPLPGAPANSTSYNEAVVQMGGLHQLSKRVNLNPFHYMTLPIKNNWDKVSPILDKYNIYSRIVSILLGGIGLIAMLDNHHWKLPRWPWAKDGLNNPRPSFTHVNEKYTVDELAEEKLMEILKEMKMHEGGDDISLGIALPPESEDEAVIDVEKQFIDDSQASVDNIEELEGKAILPSP